uniref:protein ENHANCED DISEASE RESISTANCE 4 isoform X2 n=1 Tax=Erigeron canadensis TaxID=72917 RepID=UPI001CB91381|nr:protein ENHANCED DISEASE RESISTANCE 4 isoform X2 [Erigeron canadensis]
MSESPAKVRLVRCPKCENLLPEVTDYALYQCGGCGAVLSGNKHIESGISSEKSGDESDIVSNKVSKESSNLDFSNRSVKNMSLGSENGVKSNGSSGRTHDRGDDKSIDLDEPLPVIGNNRSGSRRSVRSSNWRYRESDLQEASSSYHYAPHHEYGEVAQSTNDPEVEDDRDELLRKLDELKDQIVRSRDKSKEKVPLHPLIPSYTEGPPYANMHHKSHPLLPSSNQVPLFSDPFRSQNHRRAPVMPLEQNPYHPYYSGQYVSNEMTDNRLFHHPSCSCMLCYNKHQQAPPPPPLPPHLPPVMPNDPVFYQHDYNRRFSNLSLNSHSSEPHTRWSSEIRRPPRGILATGGRRCCPVAGGSPFVACCKCYELLQVPKKNTKKMRCAACSEVMLLSIVNKRLILSVYVETKNDTVKSKDHHRTSRDAKWGGTEFSSEDYDNSGNYDFESMDKLPLGGPSLNSHKSALSFTSEDEVKVNIIMEDDNSVDAAVNSNKPSPPPSGSPLQDHFDYSTKYNRAGKGNVSRRSDMNIAAVPVNLGPHGSSMKDAAVASEIEISSNEYCVNTGTSQESGDAIRETDQQKGNESFLMSKIKKSFREFSRSSQHDEQVKVNVMVNGHPIPDRLVKKAEKLAGPIQPGDYWYDSKAGFWGIMGGPCRGIIPPFIEEFNFPMPEKCADGNTNVFVNGRELHQKDLDLLASRGLPTDTDRAYVIEISGRVLDEDSGEELEGLGKLAPTVERKKHGFGMKPPRTAVV